VSTELLLKCPFNHIHVTHGTVGKVVDMGITDAANMGAAMAPAAADTILTHFEDTGRGINDYDLIVTGDLASFGSEMLVDLCREQGVHLGDKHIDCGNVIFSPQQKNINCGGSGCGCSATVLNGYLLGRMEAGEISRMLFIATGALMSPTSGQQQDSIPGIAHAVVLERE
jgi:stage V sporulation protein AD